MLEKEECHEDQDIKLFFKELHMLQFCMKQKCSFDEFLSLLFLIFNNKCFNRNLYDGGIYYLIIMAKTFAFSYDHIHMEMYILCINNYYIKQTYFATYRDCTLNDL